jgi:hypothetical protein
VRDRSCGDHPLIGILISGQVAQALVHHPEAKVRKSVRGIDGQEFVSIANKQPDTDEKSRPLHSEPIGLRKSTSGWDIDNERCVIRIETESLRRCIVDRIYRKFKVIHNRKICIRNARNELYPHFLKAMKSLGLTSIDQIELNSPIRNHVGDGMDAMMRVAGDDWSLTKNKSSGILRHSSGSLASLPSLPDDCSEGEHNRPCSNPFWPCYEFVPPLRLIFAGLFIVASGLIVGYGRGWNVRLLCATLALSCILLSGWLMLLGHRWYCESKGSKQNYSSQHGGQSVAQSNVKVFFDGIAPVLRTSDTTEDWVSSASFRSAQIGADRIMVAVISAYFDESGGSASLSPLTCSALQRVGALCKKQAIETQRL